MRVLAVSSYGELGGGELSLAEFLVNRPAAVDAVALLVEDGPLRAHLLERGIQTWAANGYDGRPGPARSVRFTRSLLTLLSRAQPDVVWATGLKAAFMAAPACRVRRAPLVWHKIDFSLDNTVARPLAMAVNGVVSVSEAAAASLGPRLLRSKLLAVVGPPVRLPTDLRVTPNPAPTIGTAATLTPIKGQRHIIEAAAILSAEFPTLRVMLAGDSSADYPHFADELAARGAELGLGERLEMAGFVEDVGELLGRMTVFVNATYRDDRGFGWEGLSGSMLEASWAGLPVVATAAGGTPEGVKDGVTGTLVPEADPAALAGALAPYLRDPALAQATGEAGARFARERFAPQTAAARLFAALAEVVR
ncbi:MAG TPA: glycosyltransferase family 4 protein [Solirubrobacteraceae bacterium]|jgi:glycosyltransferase involved in cell wall biosynthesis|nr:glycosyltransferase family 4 protein [Solirubrobacteraceae bacterium]